MTYAITFKNKPVIEASPLIVMLDGVDLTESVEFGEVKRSARRETYPWRGIHSQATNHCNGATIALTHTKSKTRYTLEVRAFDDAVAFRHLIPGDEKTRVPDEATKFIVPPGSTVWHHDLEGHYEAVHAKSDVAQISDGEWVAPPMTFKLPEGAGYAAITEAGLLNYSGMALQADGRRAFSVGLGHKQPPSYPFRLRYSNDVERVSAPAGISGTITSPWRVVMIGADLNALVNSDVVHNLCPPPDPKLFPSGIHTDWIKPGRAVGKYLDGGANTFEEMKEFSRWAGELGFEYHVIEGFWSRWTDEQIKDLVDYSRQRGVGLWFWKHSRQLRTADAREEFFGKLHELGVVGAKIDFFDHEHKEIIDLYQELLREAAKYRIMVNFHGANKPTGELRTWPNELIREGVRGMEASRLRERARHNTTLPFTRYLAGHGDYTPVHFGARRGDTTWAHQVAATITIRDEFTGAFTGANRHDVLASSDGGVTSFTHSIDDSFVFTTRLTLTDGFNSPRKEAGIRINSPTTGEALFIVNSDAGEIVSFGGGAPFYLFGSGAFGYTPGSSILLGIRHIGGGDGSGGVANTIEFFIDRGAGIETTGPLAWSNTEGGPVNFQVGVYAQGGANAAGDFVNALFSNTTYTAVPEPGTLALFGTGLLGLLAIRRKATLDH